MSARLVKSLTCALLVAAGGLLIIEHPQDPLLASHGSLHNALEFYTPASGWGSSADISDANPSLNGGAWVYNRTVVQSNSPIFNRFAEIGRFKDTSGSRGLIIYNKQDGSGSQQIPFTITSGTHEFANQYDPNNNLWLWFVDSSYIADRYLGFSQVTFVKCGGETSNLGVESMGPTLCSDIRYMTPNGSGGWWYALWPSRSDWGDDYPYYNSPPDYGVTNFFSHGP